jgi:hypothetical protein
MKNIWVCGCVCVCLDDVCRVTRSLTGSLPYILIVQQPTPQLPQLNPTQKTTRIPKHDTQVAHGSEQQQQPSQPPQPPPPSAAAPAAAATQPAAGAGGGLGTNAMEIEIPAMVPGFTPDVTIGIPAPEAIGSGGVLNAMPKWGGGGLGGGLGGKVLPQAPQQKEQQVEGGGGVHSKLGSK